MRLPTSIPKRMPTDWVLKQIAFPPPPSAFTVFKTLDGELRPPRISVRNQARIRKACLLAGLDAKGIVGLPDPVRKGKNVEASDASKTDGGKGKGKGRDAQAKMPKGSKKEIAKFERKKKIEENMAKMDERIAAWREERRKLKSSNRPDMPF
ncbi:hypothetical protein HDU97_007623 [Phlyctochytrium planicorne]|nr:hypothetical protein HDU97_007623 [Phlyctochytrium planicorne]